MYIIFFLGILDNKVHLAEWCCELMIKLEVQGSRPLGRMLAIDNVSNPTSDCERKQVAKMPIKEAILTRQWHHLGSRPSP